MKNTVLLLVFAVCLSGCGSSDNVVVESAGENSPGNNTGNDAGDSAGNNSDNNSDNDAGNTISISDDRREVLAELPNIDFNGQYETTAPTDLGVGGSASEADEIALSAPDSGSTDSVTADRADSIVGPVNPGQTIDPGTLTAGDYDDQLNPSLYQHYANAYLQQRGQWIDVPRLDFNHRILVEVTDQAGRPFADAKVAVSSMDMQSVITLHTAANGVTSLYNNLDALPANFKLSVSGSDGTTVQQDIELQAAMAAGKIQVTLAQGEQHQSNASDTPIDLMFVIDSTGSMGDELQFLQTELSDIINAVTQAQTDIKIGLVFYRDYGDEYIVRAHGFSANLNSVQLNLNQEFASGGGDYPEAMDQALQTALAADWRDASRKILFLLADAPPHSDRMRATWTAAELAREKNIHIVPVAASGVGEDAEYIMRSAAALTNSRYLFLTDDSGFGLPHAEPEIDCYVVTSLRKAMIRALSSLHTGTRVEPASNDIIRQVGEYNEGVCSRSENTDETVAYTVLVDRNNGGQTSKRVEVITDQQTLDAVLANYGEPAAAVDFDAGSVILIDVGAKNTGGYSADIASIEAYDDHVLANIVFSNPGINCPVTLALTHPFSIIYVETQKELRTASETVSRECVF